MLLNEFFNNPGSKKNRTRVGRGIGCTKGKTCGRGVKGQKSRSGVSIRWFEGGQMPMIARLPKRGFNCPNSKIYEVIDLATLLNFISQRRLDASVIIDKQALVTQGLIKNSTKLVKLLGSSQLDRKILVKFDAYSKSAEEAIKQAGGQVL